MTITTKFDPGQTVWLHYRGAVCSAKVRRIEIVAGAAGASERYLLEEIPEDWLPSDLCASEQELVGPPQS